MSRSGLQSDSLAGLETPPGIRSSLDYGYKLPMMSRNDFEAMHQLIISVFSQGRQRIPPHLERITVDNEGFTDDHTSYLENEKPLGCTMVENDEWDKFAVWMNPSYKDSHNFRLTLSHELTHGYTGVAYQHRAHWRRWYYRVLKHLDMEGLLLRHEDDLLLHVAFYQGIRYVRFTKDYYNERLLVEEAFAKAEDEHDEVMSDLFRRLSSLRY